MNKPNNSNESLSQLFQNLEKLQSDFFGNLFLPYGGDSSFTEARTAVTSILDPEEVLTANLEEAYAIEQMEEAERWERIEEEKYLSSYSEG